MTSSSCASTRNALAVAAESASTVKSSPARTRSSFAGRGDRLGEQSALVGVIDFFAERSNASVASRAASLSLKTPSSRSPTATLAPLWTSPHRALRCVVED